MKKNKNQETKGWRINLAGVATLLSLLLFCLNTTAQESVNTAGGNATGNGGTASFSAGQIVYQTHAGTGGSVAEGVQQPFEIWVVTSIEEATGITLNILTYPNPTKNFLTLEVRDFDPNGLTYQLFDMSGKMLKDELISDTHTRIDMTQLVPAVYFVRVIQSRKEIKTFKVIKN
jgi:hypothetical protein